MEDVIDQFQNALGDKNANSSAVNEKTTFGGLYKNWGRLGLQEERRKELLETQKSNRNQKLDKFRGILDLVNNVEENVRWSNHNSSYKARYRPSIYVAGFNKASHSYNNVLMLSEWMIEKPSDFNENWYVVPCPKGVRMLVVANDGNTKCYTKYGQFRFECPTALPGGYRCANPKIKHQCCVLDCFYVEKTHTMYVLDLLAWNSTPMTDGETEFRHFWLTSKFAELTGYASITKHNKLIFKILPKTPCDVESFKHFMLSYPAFENDFPTLDGLLFFHKRGHYVSGETPLVGWLFPFMVPEVLGEDIKLHLLYSSLKPPGYINQAAYIQEFEEKYNKKNRKSRKMSTSSNTSEPINDKNMSEINTTTDTDGKNSDKMESESPSTAEEVKAVPEIMDSEEITEKQNKSEEAVEVSSQNSIKEEV